MKRSILWTGLILLATAHPAAAYEAGLFPGYSYTASGFAVGNAVASLPAHPSNVWVNPAGIAFQHGYQFYLAPHDEVSGVRDEIRDRLISVTYGRERDGFGGGFILRQNDNQAYFVGDQLAATDILEPAFLLSYGRRIGSRYAIGATAYGYQQRSDDDPLDGDMTGGVTLGALRVWDVNTEGDLPLELRTSLSVASIGPSFGVGTIDADHPTNVRGGFSMKWEKQRGDHIIAMGDLFWLPRDVRSVDTRLGGGIGLEGKISGVVAVRLGYIWDADSDRSEPTYGFGIGNEVYPHIGGMIEYGHAPGITDFADHIGVRFYYIP